MKKTSHRGTEAGIKKTSHGGTRARGKRKEKKRKLKIFPSSVSLCPCAMSFLRSFGD